MDSKPNHTIYVNNLNDKIKKPDLKAALYYLFSQHGRIIDIIAMKTQKMRGQAFVIYRELSSATTAMRAFQGLNFFDKPMRLYYARRDSNQIKEIKGLNEAQKKREEEREKRRRKKALNRQAASSGATVNGTGDANSRQQAAELTEPANNILFVHGLPPETTQGMLSMLFSQFDGFKEIRLIENRTDIAFAEYETEAQAGLARSAYQDFKLTTEHSMKIDYAKK